MLALRRLLFLLLLFGSAAPPLALLWRTLGEGGWTVAEALIFVLVAAITPWIATLFASALVGFALLARGRDPLAATWVPQSEVPTAARTAIAVAVRNEALESVLANVAPLLDALPAGAFDLWVLSDTQEPGLAEAEARAWEGFVAARPDRERLHCRRRRTNEGFKAGNVMQFLHDHAGPYDFVLMLDADSVMSAARVAALVRQLAAHPRVALIQTLITARPSADAFPRLFQFGMRHGMRAYAAGIAWWQGPDGPYWGHNALLRASAFRDHAVLPTLPGGRRILSHDQVEAALLAGAGHEVRLDPREGGSSEANPPDMLSFLARDIRWLAGNLQYFALLRLPGLRMMGRVQLGLAILLFLLSPVLFLVALLALVVAHDPAGAVAPLPGLVATWWLALMYWSPKLFGAAELALDPARRARWGGLARLAMGVAAEFLFDLLLLPIRIVAHSVGIAALLAGRTVGWAPQRRDATQISMLQAVRGLWWHTLIGLGLLAGFAASGPLPLAWALPFVLGPVVAIPFCLLTAARGFGRWLTRAGIAALPEELGRENPPPPPAG